MRGQFHRDMQDDVDPEKSNGRPPLGRTSVRPRRTSRSSVCLVEFGRRSRAYAPLLDKCAKYYTHQGSRKLKRLLLLALLPRRKDECEELENCFLLSILRREDFGRNKKFFMTAVKFEELLKNVVPHIQSSACNYFVHINNSGN